MKTNHEAQTTSKVSKKLTIAKDVVRSIRVRSNIKAGEPITCCCITGNG